MKKSLLLLGMLLPVFCIAQNTAGEIIFNEKIKLEIDLPEGQEDLAKMLPSEQNFKKSLLFNATQSVYSNWEKAEDEDDGIIQAGNDQVQIKMIVMGANDNKLFKDLEKNQLIQKEEFFGKTFLISGDINKYDWKLSGEQKVILGFNCQKATGSKDEQKYVVWFTPEIPVSSGPDAFGQLPGMILEVNIDDGQRQYLAEKIEFRKLEKDAIKAPRKGKKVSAEKFKKIVDAKMKEMEAEMGGSGGGMQIRIGN